MQLSCASWRTEQLTGLFPLFCPQAAHALIRTVHMVCSGSAGLREAYYGYYVQSLISQKPWKRKDDFQTIYLTK